MTLQQKPEIKFDAESHTYRVDGRKYPSVTQILKETGFVDDRWFTEFGTERGSRVHEACAAYDSGTLDLKHYRREIAPVIGDYLEGWIQFKSEADMSWNEIEEPMFSRIWGYAGTPDRYGSDEDFRWCIVDIKTSQSMSRVWGLQLAGYEEMAREFLGIEPQIQIDRMVVRLSPDGKYKIDTFDDIDDRDIFLGLAAAVNWKRRGTA